MYEGAPANHAAAQFALKSLMARELLTLQFAI